MKVHDGSSEKDVNSSIQWHGASDYKVEGQRIAREANKEMKLPEKQRNKKNPIKNTVKTFPKETIKKKKTIVRIKKANGKEDKTTCNREDKNNSEAATRRESNQTVNKKWDKKIRKQNGINCLEVLQMI